MDVTLYDGLVRRDLDNLALFDDLNLSATYTGHSTDEIGYVLHFDADLPEQQIEWVRIRCYTDPETETLYRQARQATISNNNWLTNVVPQVDAGTAAIINDASITQAEAITYIRELARGLRTVTEQQVAVTQQVNRIIEVILDDRGVTRSLTGR